MTIRSLIHGAMGIVIAGLVAGAVAVGANAADETNVTALARSTHFHGVALDKGDPGRVLLATHHGLFAVSADGAARRISKTRDDFMGFTPHPTDSAVLYASGHPVGGGNLGFIVSTDGGATWSKLADGAGGPVDFHQMDVSAADPKVIYGVFGDLQRSTDGGRSWHGVGAAPTGILDLAASSADSRTIYAATQSGLLRSANGGQRWTPAHASKNPATMVQVTQTGQLYAFIVGVGLVRAGEGDLRWQIVSKDFAGSVIMHLAVGPPETRTIYAVTFDTETRGQGLYVSNDDGRSWAPLGK